MICYALASEMTPEDIRKLEAHDSPTERPDKVLIQGRWYSILQVAEAQRAELARFIEQCRAVLKQSDLFVRCEIDDAAGINVLEILDLDQTKTT